MGATVAKRKPFSDQRPICRVLVLIGAVATLLLAAVLILSRFYTISWPGSGRLVGVDLEHGLLLATYIVDEKMPTAPVAGPSRATPLFTLSDSPRLWLRPPHGWAPAVSIYGTGVPLQARRLTVPLWIPLALVAGVTGLLWWRRRGHAPGQCPTCGYASAGLPCGARCPECGGPLARAP